MQMRQQQQQLTAGFLSDSGPAPPAVGGAGGGGGSGGGSAEKRTGGGAAFDDLPSSSSATASDQSQHHLFLSFLAELPSEMRRRLVAYAPVALFVHRLLSPEAQQFVLARVHASRTSVSATIGKLNPTPVVAALQALDILVDDDDNENGELVLNPAFLRAYMRALLSGATRTAGWRTPAGQDQQQQQQKVPKDVAGKCAERWDAILTCLALPGEAVSRSSDRNDRRAASDTTREVLRQAGYMQGDGTDSTLSSTGFHFLLLDQRRQLWAYLVEYFRMVGRKMDEGPLEEHIVMMIRILLVAGTAAAENQPLVLPDDPPESAAARAFHQARDCGLVYIRKTKDGVFYVSPLAALAAGKVVDSNSASTNNNSNGGIVVETNFRIYTYTSSRLQLAILSSFAELLYRFHDMCVGVLTRDSVRQALQIISFLRANAHPQALAAHGTRDSVPVTVVDQIMLWEDERRRMSFTSAAIYVDFESSDEYAAVKRFAQTHGVLLSSNDTTRVLAVTEPQGNDLIKGWYRDEKKMQHY